MTAFSATNDIVAFGLLDAIKEMGKSVPKDYSVCGCDNISMTAMHHIELTTVDPFSSEKGRDAIDVLVKRISMPENYGESYTQIEYPPKLIVRKTTGKCPR